MVQEPSAIGTGGIECNCICPRKLQWTHRKLTRSRIKRLFIRRGELVGGLAKCSPLHSAS